MQIIKQRYSITELSEELRTTDHTLRFYEKEFGLKVPKDKRGRRFYNSPLANIMYKIKCMRDEGLEIKAIKKIIELDKCNLSSNTVNEYFHEKNNTENNPNLPSQEVNDAGALVNTEKSVLTNKDSTEFELFVEQLREIVKQCVISEIDTMKQQIEEKLAKNIADIDGAFEKNIRYLVDDMDQQFNETRGILYMLENDRKKKWYNLFIKKEKSMQV